MRIKHYDAPVVLRVIEYKFLKPYLLGNEGVKEFSKLESSFNFGNDIAVGTMTSKRLHYGVLLRRVLCQLLYHSFNFFITCDR